MFSDRELRDIAARASTIDERLGGDYSALADGGGLARERLAAWRHCADPDGSDGFSRRLAALGHDDESVLPMLGPVRLRDDRPLPDWAEAFAWASEAMLAPAAPSASTGDQPIVPFEELLRPVAAAAGRRVAARCDGFFRLFTLAAVAQLDRSLLQRLAEVCASGLFGDFAVFRNILRYRSGADRLSAPAAESRAIYDAFLDAWWRGRARAFFQAKPVAARLLGTTLASWIDGTVELATRLERDRLLLSDRFFGRAPLGPVVAVEPDLSDPHRGGRTVAILRFAEGKLVYKPKSLRPDLAWAALLDWLRSEGAPMPTRPAPVLDRGGYGWATFVEADPRAGGDDYYRKAGGLLALLHLLRGSDFHSANLIASDGEPVPIDLETLLQPGRTGALAVDEPLLGAAGEDARDRLFSSVAATLFLPSWSVGPRRHVTAVGGLDGAPDRDDESGRFDDVNRDAMRLRTADAAPRPDRPPPVRYHAAAFAAGFDQLYGFLADRREAIVAGLAAFAQAPIRIVVAPTMIYALLLYRSGAYRNLDDGVAWSLHFDFLIRGDIGRPVPKERWAILAAERRALAAGDIPFFAADADGLWLDGGGGHRIESVLAATPLAQARERVARFGPTDLRQQQQVIAAMIGAPVAAAPYTATGDFRDVAIRLGRVIAAAAIERDGEACWTGMIPIDDDRGTVGILGLDLYGGGIGVGLFLAGLARATGEERFRRLALAATGPARRLPDYPREARLLGIGGGGGLASIAYGLARIGALAGEPGLLGDARRLASLISPADIAADRSHDVVAGTAGAILGLLALHADCGEPALLETARLCGDHLVASACEDPAGGVGWRTIPGIARALTGFSHGSAGIALALLRLHRATGDRRYRETACAALRHERGLYDRRTGNWPDRRLADAVQAEAPCQWCYGAAGIGLARVGCLSLVDDAEVAGEIDAALRTTLSAAPLPQDHVCCGNFGRFEFLLCAGRSLDRPDLVEIARQRARDRIGIAAAAGSFAWPGGGDSMNLGFFRGIAGIGWTLLRLTSPEALPSVLLWD